METKTANNRRLCDFGSGPSGACLVCIGGIHGNEPSGVDALRRVGRLIREESIPLQGRFIGLAGNLPALACGRRFIRDDLNRIWSQDRIRELRSLDADEATDELGEQLALLGAVNEVFATKRDDIYFVDLHTTSAGGGPFTIFGDSLKNRSFAQHFPVSMILGLEEQIKGALMEYLGDLGAVTMGFEAGPHSSPESPHRQEAAIWIALVASGVLAPENCSRLEESRKRLRDAAASYPGVLEVRHRQSVELEDGFQMEPGFQNFDLVKKGQRLARDTQGTIRSPENGRILMPLYQSQGSDGFFIVCEIWPFWLKLSKLLRALPLSSLIPHLPGVRRHPEISNALLVNPSIASWATVEFFHLCGYRTCPPEGKLLVFKRRDQPALESAAG